MLEFMASLLPIFLCSLKAPDGYSSHLFLR